MDTDDLIHKDGQAHCPNDDCGWWVPAGMEYLYLTHECDSPPDDFLGDVEIVKTPEVLSGRPRIDGLRVGVLQVGDLIREHGMTFEVVMDELRLEPEEALAALSYYDDHADEMDTLREQRETTIEEIRKNSRASED